MMPDILSRPAALALIMAALLSLAAQTRASGTKEAAAPAPSVADMTAMGRRLFHDRGLSASGRQSCADCHDPGHAYAPANRLAVQPGGNTLQNSGMRAAPSLRYLQSVPAFTEHHFDDDGDDSIDQGAAGGYTWDGRAPTRHAQAALPVFSPEEMANNGPAQFARKIQGADYADEFRRVFGKDVFAHPETVVQKALMALEVFQQSPQDFYPYDSKYDAFLRGQARLSAQEARGLRAFNDPRKGNCASCHPSAIMDGAFPVFTDFGFVALGVPRNPEIPANRDPLFHDLGLCGPLRRDLSSHAEYCGRFRTPSLRNVARRHRFFHNGIFRRLDEVLHFYAERDTRPGKWYPRNADGSVKMFDDLPAQYRGNVNRDAPFGKNRGAAPALKENDIRDIIAFLGTLNDGYTPPQSAGRAATSSLHTRAR